MTLILADFTKYITETLDYTINWSAALMTTQSIVSAVWTVPAGLTQVQSSVVGTSTIVRVSGGTPGTTYTLECVITLSDGQLYSGGIDIVIPV